MSLAIKRVMFTLNLDLKRRVPIPLNKNAQYHSCKSGEFPTTTQCCTFGKVTDYTAIVHCINCGNNRLYS